MHRTGKTYVYELDGLGRKMPVTFACFTVAGLSLMGIPLFAGFISKWNIAGAAAQAGGVMGVLSISVLLYSALMTGIYMLTVTVRAFFPGKGFDEKSLDGVKEADWKMLVPIVAFTAAIVILGLYSGPLMGFLENVTGGGSL